SSGDLGYEVWVATEKAVSLWDWLMQAGRPYDITPAGMLALDVARIEAGLILLDVDYVSAKKALVATQKYTPYEIGLGRLVHLDKAPYVGQAALKQEAAAGPRRQLVGLEVDWDELERLYDEAGLPPQLPATASRVSVPVYRDDRHVGHATGTPGGRARPRPPPGPRPQRRGPRGPRGPRGTPRRPRPSRGSCPSPTSPGGWGSAGPSPPSPTRPASGPEPPVGAAGRGAGRP